jgi:hypothetical protein
MLATEAGSIYSSWGQGWRPAPFHLKLTFGCKPPTAGHGRSETVERQLKRFQLEAEISASGRRFCAWLDRGDAEAYSEICADLIFSLLGRVTNTC